MFKKSAFFAAIKKEGQPLVFSALCSWLLTLSILSIISPIAFIRVPDYTDSISILLFLGMFIALFIALYCLNRFWNKKSLFLILPLSFLLYGIVSIALSANNAATRAFSAFIFSVLAIVVLVLCINYAKDQKISILTKDISFKATLITVIVAFIVLSAYWIFLLWARLETFCAPCFDMGIFTQMYDNMADPSQGFLPITTCERGTELSHFAVHFSPILYLLMPFCIIFEPTVVLTFAQILLVLSAVFPLLLICREIKLSNIKTLIICLLFLLYPVMSSGSFYDFHENAFLAPLIMWTLYFSHKKKWYNTLLMFVFALLVLMVKEDAALYVAFISLYVIFGQKKYIRGAAMFVMTVGYFFFAISMISYFQQDMLFGAEGNMLSSRYANIIGEEAGFLSLVKVFILNPALYAVESFTADKMIYALNMLLPLAFLPLITRKPSRWLLLGPFYILNLVTDYRYQYDIGFQYSFGSGALLVYLATVNLADLSNDAFFPAPEVEEENALTPNPSENNDQIDIEVEPIIFEESEESETATAEISSNKTTIKNTKSKFISSITAITLVFAMFATMFVQAGRAPAHYTYARRLSLEVEDRKVINEVLSKIDRSKSIMATSMYLTHLYDADKLYSTLQAFDSDTMIIIFTDIVVLDLRPHISDSKNAKTWSNRYLMQNYKIVENHENLIMVLERTEASPPTGYSKAYIEYRKDTDEPLSEEVSKKIYTAYIQYREDLEDAKNEEDEENAYLKYKEAVLKAKYPEYTKDDSTNKNENINDEFSNNDDFIDDDDFIENEDFVVDFEEE